MLVPNDGTAQAFHGVVGPMHRLVTGLRAMSRNLRETRDLLLPGLISGEIDVENLAIDISGLAA